ncbi:MAG: PHP domain-containing protein [Planctomycetes bacterium]|nr:PHP domain-containing protein [Planctomycetota bacterium]
MNSKKRCLVAIVVGTLICANVLAEPRVLLDGLRHLRIAGPREWTEFPMKPDAERIELTFKAKANAGEATLSVRQQDVKQRWNVTLNEKQLGQLKNDENDMLLYFSVPPRTLIDGENTLLIEQDARRRKSTDDIRVGSISLDDRAVDDVLSEAMVEVNVFDDDTEKRLPARITILNAGGALQTVGAQSNDHLAVRAGIIYTSTGRASFGLPPGRYTIYAGRGFEYSLDRVEVTVVAGDKIKRTLKIRREVPTEGFVACDTHVHTRTHSGHGDSTVDERMITIAAEGIELPIATDHNVHIDHNSFARKMKVREYFTPVIGNEVTTRIGHFNIFPVKPGAAIPDYKLADWKSILKGIYRTANVKIAILNHPRDNHGGTTPFGPKLHNAVVGENIAGWHMGFNAMEVINSGATQTNVLRLFHDWMGLLNRGYQVTPVGSSDSHDVARHFVGQGRTYIRCNDRDPGNIDVDEAVANFVQGKVMVSYGLLTELIVNNKFRSGEISPAPDEEIQLDVRVLGPHWSKASKILLFANGQLIREKDIPPGVDDELPTGIKAVEEFRIARPKHDVHLVAIAVGPGIDGLYWTTAKAYQPTSPAWRARVVGCSGAVWLDVDGDRKRTSAHEYARRLFTRAGGDLKKMLGLLAAYDEAVAAQAAHLYQLSGKSLLTDGAQALLNEASPKALAGIRRYLAAWRENQLARSGE